jgi:hypothetical protein
MSEFLRIKCFKAQLLKENKYFFNEKPPSYNLIPNFCGIRALLKENPLIMSEFLRNNYFFKEISPSYILIPEKDHFLKGKYPSFARILEKLNTLLKDNPQKCLNFLGISALLKGNPLKMSEFLKNIFLKVFFFSFGYRKSVKNVNFSSPNHDCFLKKEKKIQIKNIFDSKKRTSLAPLR